MMSADTKRRSLVGFPLLGFLLRLSGQLLLLLLLLVGFVLGTQTGLRTAIGIAEEFAPEMISVGRAEGRVLGELSIADLTLDLPGLALRLGSLHLDWQPGALLTGKLRVTDLAIADVDVVVEPSDEPPPPKEPAELPEIKLPIGIDIERVLVERLSFSQAGAPPESAIRLTRAELSATALADAVDLRRLMVEMAQPEATANATGNATLSGDYPLNLDLDWRFSQPPALVVKGDGTVSGTLAELLVEHRVSGIAELTLDATLERCPEGAGLDRRDPAGAGRSARHCTGRAARRPQREPQEFRELGPGRGHRFAQRLRPRSARRRRIERRARPALVRAALTLNRGGVG
jgi:autotransporter translocation and assembly factor TamB